MAIGLKRGLVRLCPHDPAWKRDFEREKRLIGRVLKNNLLGIEHIGSTAIPGLSAKPIIDIAVGVRALRQIREYARLLKKAGYAYLPRRGTTRRKFFPKGSTARRTAYVHLVKFAGIEWRKFLAFRDFLRVNKRAAGQYLEVKQKLAQRFPEDRDAYTKAKARLIAAHIQPLADAYYRKRNKLAKPSGR